MSCQGAGVLVHSWSECPPSVACGPRRRSQPGPRDQASGNRLARSGTPELPRGTSRSLCLPPTSTELAKGPASRTFGRERRVPVSSAQNAPNLPASGKGGRSPRRGDGGQLPVRAGSRCRGASRWLYPIRAICVRREKPLSPVPAPSAGRSAWTRGETPSWPGTGGSPSSEPGSGREEQGGSGRTGQARGAPAARHRSGVGVSPTAPRTGLIQWPGSTRARRGTGDSPRSRAATEAGRCCPPGDTPHSLGHLVGHAGMEWVEAQRPQAQGGPKCPQCPGSPGQRLSEGRSVGVGGGSFQAGTVSTRSGSREGLERSLPWQ